MGSGDRVTWSFRAVIAGQLLTRRDELIDARVELAAFGVEEGGDPVGEGWPIASSHHALPGRAGEVGSDSVQGIDSDDSDRVGQVHAFCQRNGNTQPCETARSDGDVDLVNVGWDITMSLEKAADGREKLATMLHGTG